MWQLEPEQLGWITRWKTDVEELKETWTPGDPKEGITPRAPKV